jgi:hypothetical protein
MPYRDRQQTVGKGEIQYWQYIVSQSIKFEVQDSAYCIKRNKVTADGTPDTSEGRAYILTTAASLSEKPAVERQSGEDIDTELREVDDVLWGWRGLPPGPACGWYGWMSPRAPPLGNRIRTVHGGQYYSPLAESREQAIGTLLQLLSKGAFLVFVVSLYLVFYPSLALGRFVIISTKTPKRIETTSTPKSSPQLYSSRAQALLLCEYLCARPPWPCAPPNTHHGSTTQRISGNAGTSPPARLAFD